MATVLWRSAVQQLAVPEGPVHHADLYGRAAAWAPDLPALTDVRVLRAVAEDDHKMVGMTASLVGLSAATAAAPSS